MATYQHTTGEQSRTVNGSRHDRRLADSPDWTLVDDAGTDEQPPDPPSRAASKDEWVIYAGHRGVDEDTANKATRAELIALLDDQPTPDEADQAATPEQE